MMKESSTLIALCGFMGSGKTALGRALAARLGYAFADTDEMLLSRTGMTLAQMFSIGGEGYFRDREHETIADAAALERTVLSTGGGVMTFPRNAGLLRDRAVIVHIVRDFDACYAAVSRRTGRPLAGQKSREELRALYDARQAAYARYADVTIRNDRTRRAAVEDILTELRRLGIV